MAAQSPCRGGRFKWLAEEGFPAARLVDGLEQPFLIAGHPVTFWRLIVEGSRKATYGELGGILRDLHSMTLPAGLELPSFNPFDKQELRISQAAIPEDDRVFLRKRWSELRGQFEELGFETPKGPVRGDAHVQNLMVNDRGEVILIDFEAFCFDHPEWDLMVTSVEHHSLGWQTDEQYADFVRAVLLRRRPALSARKQQYERGSSGSYATLPHSPVISCGAWGRSSDFSSFGSPPHRLE